jgi:hypothetical protein
MIMDYFLDIVVAGDKTWVYHYKLESKWQSLEWRHMDSQTKREFKVQPSIGKIMFPIFFGFPGVGMRGQFCSLRG